MCSVEKLSVAEEVKLLLDGKIPKGEEPDFITGQGVLDFVPICMKSVCYVVAVVLIDEEGNVLLTQEGFDPCRGQWYLPAGRVDPNETLEEAGRREVREETGLDCELSTLISVESGSGEWWRFTFTGKVTGGSLRTLQEQDDETMQAAWWSLDDINAAAARKHSGMILRGRDIIRLISLTVMYKNPSNVEDRHPEILPVNKPHTDLQSRPLIINLHKDRDYVRVLVSREGEAHIPIVGFSPRKEQRELRPHYISALLKDGLEGSRLPHFQLLGLLGLEHCGKPRHENDGLSFSLFVVIRTTCEEGLKTTSSRYQWMDLEGDLREQVLKRIDKPRSVPYLT